MNIINLKIKDLKPYSKNAKKHDDVQIGNVAESIKQFGMVQPIVVDKDNVVIIGHCRLEACKRLKFKEVPCVKADELSEEQVAKLRLLDNKLNESEWDFDLLSEELFELDLSDFELDWGLPELVEEKEDLEIEIKNAKSSLAEKFLIPPFGVIDTRKGYYQKRKHYWKKLIQDNGEARGLNNTKKTALCKNMVSKNLSDVSLLDPVISEIICSWFLPQGENVCIDCFAGDTVFGYVSSFLGNKFYGIEIRQEQVDFNNLHTNDNAKYFCDSGTNILKYVDEKSCDLLFSCPPYFDLEVYSDLKEDASNQPTYDKFFEIIEKAFADSIKCLKENRFAVVIASDIRDKNGNYYDFCGDIKDVFKKNGLGLYNEFILHTANVSGYMRANKQFGEFRKMIKDYQNVLVFYNGKTKDIPKHFGKVEVAEIESENMEL